MLLQALVACAGVTLRSVAVNRDIPVRGGRVIAEGDLDFRGTMAVSRETPVGFRSIRLRFELDSPAKAEDLEALLSLTERYCVVYQTLTNGVPVSVGSQYTPQRACIGVPLIRGTTRFVSPRSCCPDSQR
jgi:uncharacterized OsmC-like protein